MLTKARPPVRGTVDQRPQHPPREARDDTTALRGTSRRQFVDEFESTVLRLLAEYDDIVATRVSQTAYQMRRGRRKVPGLAWAEAMLPDDVQVLRYEFRSWRRSRLGPA